MDKVWLENYPADVPAQIDTRRYSSLLDMFEQSTARFDDKTAFINMGQTLSFRELEMRSRAFASYLQHQLGLEVGDRVAVMMPNLLQYPIAVFGILRAGMVVVNVNPLYTPRELEHQLNDSGATTIIILANFAHTLEKAMANTVIKNVIVTRLGDQLPPLKGWMINTIVKYIKKGEPHFSLPGAIDFAQTMKSGDPQVYRRPQIQQHDLAFLQYTGGTSGVAKGAMLSHGNMLANLAQVKAAFLPVLTEGKELVVTALPLYHIFALTMNCLLFLEIGGSNLLITNPRDIKALVKTLEKYAFTAMTGVNTLFNALLNNDDFRRLDFSSLHLSAGGGMQVQQSVAERWEALTGRILLEGYGLTECAPLVTANPHNIRTYSGNIGLPVPSTQVRLINDLGEEVAPGEPGELCVKGPQVMSGYWQKPQATEEAFIDGWLRTGDIVTMSADGFLRIVDRKKDMILVSGFNVYPNEIEDVVMQHPGVLEVAAVGVPAGACGEAVKIYVVKSDLALDEASLLQFCRRQLTGYKVPRLIEFRSELPKSNVGKILRRALRDEAANLPNTGACS